MSDGPHRSLPINRKWQNVAERADNRAFGIDDIGAAMGPALAADCRDEMNPEFIERIRGVFEEQETLLIKDNIKARIEALRPEAGTGMGRRLIDNVMRVSEDDTANVRALVDAMSRVLAERKARRSWQVEEHYLRKSTAPRANNVRQRLEQAMPGAALETLARQVLKADDKRPARSSTKRRGLDEGPSLR